MNNRQMLRTTGKVMGLLLSATSVVLVGSQVFGGPVSMVLVRGSSMEPAYHQGDMVIVRRAEYRSGDAVAYRSARLGAIVLHRIVRQEGDGFVFKGDSNAWLDPDSPARSELIGKHLLRVPFAGTAVAALRTPQGVGIAAAASALLAATGALIRRKRRGRTRALRPGHAESVVSLSRAKVPGKGMALGLGAGAVVLVAVSAATFLVPTAQQAPATFSFKHTGKFAYSARVPRGPVYETGKVATGDPVYLNVAPSLDVSFDYRFGSEVAHDIQARGRLLVEVADDTGWKHSIAIQPATAFEGDEAVLRGRLDLERIWGVIEQFQQLTGIQTAAYSLAIIPELQVTGTVAEKPINEQFAPRLALRLDRLLLRLAPSATAEGSADEPPPDPLEPSQPGAVKLQDGGRPAISLASIDLDAALARRASIFGALACLLGLALVIWRGRSRSAESDDEAALILRRYGRWIVPVASRQARSEGPLVAVDSIDGLLRLADRYGRMILQENGDGPAAFLVEEGGTIYRYSPGHATPAVRASQNGSVPEGHGVGEANVTTGSVDA